MATPDRAVPQYTQANDIDGQQDYVDSQTGGGGFRGPVSAGGVPGHGGGMSKARDLEPGPFSGGTNDTTPATRVSGKGASDRGGTPNSKTGRNQ